MNRKRRAEIYFVALFAIVLAACAPKAEDLANADYGARPSDPQRTAEKFLRSKSADLVWATFSFDELRKGWIRLGALEGPTYGWVQCGKLDAGGVERRFFVAMRGDDVIGFDIDHDSYSFFARSPPGYATKVCDEQLPGVGRQLQDQ